MITSPILEWPFNGLPQITIIWDNPEYIINIILQQLSAAAWHITGSSALSRFWNKHTWAGHCTYPHTQIVDQPVQCD